MKALIFLLGLLACPTALKAAGYPIAYVCNFTEVARATIEHNQLSPWKVGKEVYSRTYTAINLHKNTAIAIGETGAAEDVYAERIGSKINFIERSRTGNMFLTTIMDPGPNGKRNCDLRTQSD